MTNPIIILGSSRTFGETRKVIDSIIGNNKIPIIDLKSLDIKPFMIIPYKIKQIEEAEKKAETGLDRRFNCKYCDSDYASPSGKRRHELQIHINSNASQGSMT